MARNSRGKSPSSRDYQAEGKRRKEIAAQKGISGVAATGHGSQIAPDRPYFVPATPRSPDMWGVGPWPKPGKRLLKNGTIKYTTAEQNYRGAKPVTAKGALAAIRKIPRDVEFFRVAVYGFVSEDEVYGVIGGQGHIFQFLGAVYARRELVQTFTGPYKDDMEMCAFLITGYHFDLVLSFFFAESFSVPPLRIGR